MTRTKNLNSKLVIQAVLYGNSQTGVKGELKHNKIQDVANLNRRH